MEYTIIYLVDLIEFEKEINAHLADGWRLCGQLIYEHGSNGVFCREMVRGEEPDPSIDPERR